MDIYKKVIGSYKQFANDEAGSADLIKGMITIAVGYAVFAVLGPSLVAPGISSIQNTAAITNYTTWDPQQKTMWTATGTFTMLGWMLVPVALIMALF